MNIINLSKLNQTVKSHLLTFVFALFVTIVGIVGCFWMLLHRQPIFLFILFALVVIFSAVIGTYDLLHYLRLRHDLRTLQQSIGPIAYRYDCVCCGEEPLQAFDTIYKSGVGGVYLDTFNRSIIISVEKEEE